MQKITFNEKKYELQLTYDGVEFLEDHFDKGLINIFNDVDITRQKNLRTLYRSFLINEDLSDEDMRDMFKSSINSEENDFMTMVELATKVFQESTFLKKAVEKGKKEQQKNNLKQMNA